MGMYVYSIICWDEASRRETDTRIELPREDFWKESLQHRHNRASNYPWYCFNNQQHPFNDGLCKQCGFIGIAIVYIWHTMDLPANGLVITNMHIVTLQSSVLLSFANLANWFLLVENRSSQTSRWFHWLRERRFLQRFSSVSLRYCRCNPYEGVKSVLSQIRPLLHKDSPPLSSLNKLAIDQEKDYKAQSQIVAYSWAQTVFI